MNGDLPDSLAVRLIGSSLPLEAQVVVFTNFCQRIGVTKHANLIIESCYKARGPVANGCTTKGVLWLHR